MNEYELDKIVGAFETIAESINLLNKKFETQTNLIIKELQKIERLFVGK